MLLYGCLVGVRSRGEGRAAETSVSHGGQAGRWSVEEGG